MSQRPDGSLAPVTYLFGGDRAQHPAGRSAAPDPDHHPDPDPDPAPEAEGTTSDDAARWAVPGVVHEEAPEPAEPTRASRRAHNVGLNALTKRGQSIAEMRSLLESRELDDETVEAEIARLLAVGLLDDLALAETLVRTLGDRKGLGTSGISAELRRRKIDPLAIETVLAQVDADEELERAIEVATKRAGQLRSYDAETAKRRLGAYLQRRGYSGSVFSAAMSAALAGSAPRSTRGPRFD